MTARTQTTPVSISFPNDLLAKLRLAAGPRGVSAYVTRAVDEALAFDGMREIVERLEDENGPSTPEELRRARKALEAAFGKPAKAAA
jgi:hypothetical protein